MAASMVETASRKGSIDARASLVVEALSHRYGQRTVVDQVSFSLQPGEVHCLMGPSGCGKTTTLRLIAGLLPVQQGTVHLGDELIAAFKAHVEPEKRRIGLMFQDLALFPHLSVSANIAFGLRGHSKRDRKLRVRELLELVGLQAHAEDYPSTLSGGEQQRVALARALAPKPRLMLLDEAFSALDAGMRASVREHTLELLRGQNVPTLLVTHDPEEAIFAGDQVHVMQSGKIVQSGRPDELYGQPANEFIASFFGPTLHFAGHVQGGLVPTPLGIVAAPEHGDGKSVDVVFRAEAIELQPNYDGEGNSGEIVACRRMGPSCSLSLKLNNGAMITLQKPSDSLHHVGMRVGFQLDNSHAFVFPYNA